MAEAGGATLSACLRTGTAAVHQRVEQVTQLPDCIENVADYAECLAGFQRIFAPLERHLAAFAEWPVLGIDLAAHARAPALRADLGALGVDAEGLVEMPMAPPSSFPAALGALYVLEGSALGGRVILRALQARLGAVLHGATAFFGGTSPMPWPAFKAALDDFGARYPTAQPDVLAGARQTFRIYEEGFKKKRFFFEKKKQKTFDLGAIGVETGTG